MTDLVVQFVTILGLAVWLPTPAGVRRFWLGARLALAGCVVVVALFLGTVALKLPLTLLSSGLFGCGCLGTIAALAKRRDAFGEPLHPAYVLSALLLAVIGIHGGLAYQPYLGDEFASWLNLTRQIYIADAAQAPMMDYHLPDYTDGWPLLLAAAGGPYDAFSLAHDVPVQFLLHLGVIGFVYDIVRARDDRTRFSAYGWVVVLVLLAAEATWKLLPTDMLIEQPLLYAYALCLFPILAYETQAASPLRSALYIGLALAAGYLFKLSMAAILPAPAIFFLAAAWKGERRGLVVLAAILFAPLLVIALIWHFAASGGEMGATVGTAFSIVGARAVAIRMLLDLWSFAAAFKMPLTVAAVAILIAAAITRRYPVMLFAIVGFVGLYATGMYVAYLGRYASMATIDQPLEYFQRFIILPVRLLHLMGVVVGALLLQRTVERRIAVPVLAVLCLAGLAWQARALDRSLTDMADRRYQNPTLIRQLTAVSRDAAQLAREIATRGMASPTVGVADPLGYGVAHDAILFYSLNDHRGGPLRLYRYDMVNDGSRNLATYDILWPVTVTADLRDRFAALSDDPACAQQPERYFLIRRSGAGYDCLRRESAK